MIEENKDEETIFPELNVQFAGFGPRFGASLIDGIVLFLISIPITYFNVTSWKMPFLFILTSLVALVYKPFLEYRFGATLGKMAVGIRVVGYQFEPVTLTEELRRVSFYIIPTLLTAIFQLKTYFSPAFLTFTGYNEYNQYIISSNPAILWLNGIVFFLFIADCITFFSNPQNRSLHDLYAHTYVIYN